MGIADIRELIISVRQLWRDIRKVSQWLLAVLAIVAWLIGWFSAAADWFNASASKFNSKVDELLSYPAKALRWKYTPFLLLFLTCVGGIMLFLSWAIRQANSLYLIVVRHISPHRAEIGIVAIAFVLGFMAYLFKRHYQRCYGAVKFLFGGASIVNIASSMPPGTFALSQWASLIGCIYVIARGIDNYLRPGIVARKDFVKMVNTQMESTQLG